MKGFETYLDQAVAKLDAVGPRIAALDLDNARQEMEDAVLLLRTRNQAKPSGEVLSRLLQQKERLRTLVEDGLRFCESMQALGMVSVNEYGPDGRLLSMAPPPGVSVQG